MRKRKPGTILMLLEVPNKIHTRFKKKCAGKFGMYERVIELIRKDAESS